MWKIKFFVSLDVQLFKQSWKDKIQMIHEHQKMYTSARIIALTLITINISCMYIKNCFLPVITIIPFKNAL